MELLCAGRPRADVWGKRYFQRMVNCFSNSVGSIGMCFGKEILIGRVCPESCTDGFRTPLEQLEVSFGACHVTLPWLLPLVLKAGLP